MRLTGLLILLCFQLAGEALARWLGLPVPGPVIGLLLLFAALVLRGSVPPALEAGSRTMIELLPMLLIATSAGLFFLGESFDDQWPAFIAAVVGGTVLALAFAAAVMKWVTAGRHRG